MSLVPVMKASDFRNLDHPSFPICSAIRRWCAFVRSPAPRNQAVQSLFPAFPSGPTGSRPGASLGWPEPSAPRVGPASRTDHRRLAESPRPSERKVRNHTKSGAARNVEMSQELADELRNHMAIVRHYFEEKDMPVPTLLFPSTTGSVLDVDNTGGLFNEICASAGIHGFTLYDLRHTYASLLLMRALDRNTCSSSSGTKHSPRRYATMPTGYQER